MQFDGSLVLSEVGPWKHRQAQVDGCCVESVSCLFQFESKRFVAVKFASRIDQRISQIGVDLPVPLLVGIGNRWSWHLAANAHMIKFLFLGTQADFDISQTFAIGDLRKGHAEVLIEAGELLYFVIALIPGNAAAECMQRHKVQNLWENEFASVHVSHPPVGSQENAQTDNIFSSR